MTARPADGNAAVEAGWRTLIRQTPHHWAALTPLQTVPFSPLTRRCITLKIKREDALDSRLSGNKLYKLYGHWQEAKVQGARRLISFGGYYSNHLHALAYLGRAAGMATLGIVRGQEPQLLSDTLQDCRDQGMALHFVSRQQYRQLRTAGQDSAEALRKGLQADLPPDTRPDHPGHDYVIPEGGGGSAGLSGCGAIMTALRAQTDLTRATVCVACGTGTTLAGLLAASLPGERLLGFAALKLGEHLSRYSSDVMAQLDGRTVGGHWDIFDDRYFGGFAKTQPQLFAFMRSFESETGVLLDPVYTAKLLYQLVQLAEAGYWPAGHEIIVVHSGGLQGRRGYPELIS